MPSGERGGVEEGGDGAGFVDGEGGGVVIGCLGGVFWGFFLGKGGSVVGGWMVGWKLDGVVGMEMLEKPVE